MYCYLYDEFIQENKRYERELLQIENRLTDLGIAGKISRLALFRNAEEMIRDEIDRGVKTVVVLGNDDTVRKLLDVISESDITLGIIPIGPKNELARLLGIPQGIMACDVLSARRIERIDMGTINGRKFITGVHVPNFRAELMCNDGKYRIVPTSRADLRIDNLAEVTNPCDGILNANIRASVKTGWGPFARHRETNSLLPFRFLAIRSDKPIAAYADGEEMQGTRFDIGIEPMTLKVIIGKQRSFVSS
jgi:diacylglycerol kinase family enzyme